MVISEPAAVGKDHVLFFSTGLDIVPPFHQKWLVLFPITLLENVLAPCQKYPKMYRPQMLKHTVDPYTCDLNVT